MLKKLQHLHVAIRLRDAQEKRGIAIMLELCHHELQCGDTLPSVPLQPALLQVAVQVVFIATFPHYLEAMHTLKTGTCMLLTDAYVWQLVHCLLVQWIQNR